MLNVSRSKDNQAMKFGQFIKYKGEDTLWNISFRLFHETQFNTYFITFNLISWNSYKISKEEPSANYDRKKWIQKGIKCSICHWQSRYFFKKTTKQKTKRTYKAYGLSPNWKVICIQVPSMIYSRNWWLMIKKNFDDT